MAFPNETVTATAVAKGHVILKINGTQIGRVVDVSEMDTAHGLYEHRGGNSGGTDQIVAIFETNEPTGKVTCTIDEVPDLDAGTLTDWVTNVTLQQQYPKATDTAWTYTAAKAYVDYGGLKPNRDTPSTVTVTITPYNDPGTAAWTFANNTAV